MLRTETIGLWPPMHLKSWATHCSFMAGSSLLGREGSLNPPEGLSFSSSHASIHSAITRGPEIAEKETSAEFCAFWKQRVQQRRFRVTPFPPFTGRSKPLIQPQWSPMAISGRNVPLLAYLYLPLSRWGCDALVSLHPSQRVDLFFFYD
jgi:hypothetical protein